MLYSIEQVESGLARFLDTEMLPKLPNDGLKGFGVGVGATILVRRGGNILRSMQNNTMLNSMGIISANGAVDIDLLRDALKENIPANGLSVNLPMGIAMRFTNNDIDRLYACIKESV